MNRLHAYFVTFFVLLIFGFFFLYPVANSVTSAFLNKGEFTFEYILNVFLNPVYREGIINALMIGIGSTIFAFFIAFPLALVSHRYNFPFKRILSIFILIPLVLPPFVGAIGIKQIIGINGALNSFLIDIGLMSANAPFDWLESSRFFGVVSMNALHLYPILYLNIVAALNNLDPLMEQAAHNLGAKPLKRFFRITFPLCMPSIFAGAIVVFIWAFTELGVPLVFDYARTTPVQIFDGMNTLQSNPMPYALVAITILISSCIFLLSRFLLRGSFNPSSERNTGRIPCKELNWKTGGGFTLIYVVLILIASIPHASVFFLSVSDDWYQTLIPEVMTSAHYAEGLGHPLTVNSIKNSLLYSAGATVLDFAIGLAIAWVIVRSTIWGRNILDALLMLPLAVPGIVVAFGYFTLSAPGEPFHFLVTMGGGPVFLLMIAYAIRRLPYIVRSAIAGLQQSHPSLEEAARSMGATPIQMLKRVAIPLVVAHILAGSILTFAFAMLEVSNSLILVHQADHYPITKTIYSLLSTLGNGYEIASALGVWAMIFLGISIAGAMALVGRRCENLFRA